MSDTEATLRQRLGIPADAKQVIILTEAAHNDYDWTYTFLQYYGIGPSADDPSVQQVFDGLFSKANGPLISHTITDNGSVYLYNYDACEIAFLRKYCQDNPDALTLDLRSLYIVGGGITSPSSLVSNGECFIRNFLQGDLWVCAKLPYYAKGERRLQNAWLPDDFALDPELPAILEAMDLVGVGFSRIAGNIGAYCASAQTGHAIDCTDKQVTTDCTDKQVTTWVAPADSPLALLLPVQGGKIKGTLGTEFLWQAADGAQIFTHFMPGTYGELYSKTDCTTSPYSIVFKQDGSVDGSDCMEGNITLEGAIQNAAAYNAPVATTPYIHVPVSEDVMQPCINLLEIIQAFNKSNYYQDPTQSFATLVSFDDFVALVLAFWSDNPSYMPKSVQSFVSTPVIDGFYASCSDLKRLHQTATDSLLGAEVFAAMLYDLNPAAYQAFEQSLRQFTPALSKEYQSWEPVDGTLSSGWEALVPSTHHAYVVGLSMRDVYREEQRCLINAAQTIADNARSTAIAALASSLPGKQPGGSTIVAVFNQLGFDRQHELVDWEISGDANVNYPGVQTYQDNGKPHALFFADAPSMGYQTVDLSTLSPPQKEVSVTNPDPETYVLDNGILSATLRSVHGVWKLTEVRDLQTGRNMLAESRYGNDLFLYDEHYNEQNCGDVFQFYYEKGSSSLLKLASIDQFVPSLMALSVVEKGPLRVRIKTQVTITVSVYAYPNQEPSQTPQRENQRITFTQEYILVAGESYLQMRSTGAAPNGYAVFAAFPLAAVDSNNPDIVNLTYGTPYYWRQAPIRPAWQDAYNGWPGPFFNGTFNFVIPQDAAGNSLAAMYHNGVTAWGATSTTMPDTQPNTLYGCLWRNPPFPFWKGDATPLNNQDQSLPGQPDTYIMEYALRLPYQGAEGEPGNIQGKAFPESLAFQTPLQAALPTGPGSATANQTYSLARISTGAPAFLRVAKRNSRPDTNALILRTFNPQPPSQSDSGLPVSIQLRVQNGQPQSATPVAHQVSALEKPITNTMTTGIDLTTSAGTISFDAIRSLTTVAITD